MDEQFIKAALEAGRRIFPVLFKDEWIMGVLCSWRMKGFEEEMAAAGVPIQVVLAPRMKDEAGKEYEYNGKVYIPAGYGLTPLRRVQWVNFWDRGMKELHSDVGCLAHLTAYLGFKGKTLCGKEYPEDKGQYSPARYCRRCINAAYKIGYEKGFTKQITDFVPSKREF
jgi:hypothetical protein